MIFSKIATRRDCLAILGPHNPEEPELDKALTVNGFQIEFQNKGYLYYNVPPEESYDSSLFDKNRLICLSLIKNPLDKTGTLIFDFKDFPFTIGSWYAEWDDGTIINYGGITTVAGSNFIKDNHDGYVMVGYDSAGNTSIPAIQCELYGAKTRIPSSAYGANKISIGYTTKDKNSTVKVTPLYS